MLLSRLLPKSVPLLVRAVFGGRRRRSSSHRQSIFHFPFVLSCFPTHLVFIPSLCVVYFKSNQIKFIYIALRTSADISKCCTETQPKTPNSKQCRCRSTVARKNSLERPKPRKKPREEPGYEGWPVLFWLCRVEIITEHGQDVQMFINDQHGQIIIITVVVEGAASQHLRSKCQLAFHSRSLRVSLPLLLSLES